MLQLEYLFYVNESGLMLSSSTSFEGLLYWNFYKKDINCKRIILIKGLKFYIFNWFILGICSAILLKIMRDIGADESMFKPVLLNRYILSCHSNAHIVFLMILFVFPLVEELAFRLGLSFKKVHVMISLPVFQLYLFMIFFQYSDTSVAALKYSCIAVCAASIVLLKFVPQFSFNLLKAKGGGFIICVVTFFFGFIHLSNYLIININYLPVYLFLCLPQLVMGMTAVYFRLNLGFFYSWIFHVLVNLIAIVLY